MRSVITEIVIWGACHGQALQPESCHIPPHRGPMIQRQKQKVPCPLSDAGPKGAGYLEGVSTQHPAHLFSHQPSFQIIVHVENSLPLTPLEPSYLHIRVFNCLSIEPARIRIFPLYLLSFLPNPDVQPPCSRPYAGSSRQHRDESDTFPAHKELTLSGQEERKAVQEAPTVSQKAQSTLLLSFIYTGFLSLTTIDILGQRILCRRELSYIS